MGTSKKQPDGHGTTIARDGVARADLFLQIQQIVGQPEAVHPERDPPFLPWQFARQGDIEDAFGVAPLVKQMLMDKRPVNCRSQGCD